MRSKQEIAASMSKAGEGWGREGNNLSLGEVRVNSCNIFFAIPFGTPEQLEIMKDLFLEAIRKYEQYKNE